MSRCPICVGENCDALDWSRPHRDVDHQFDRELIAAHASWRRANGLAGDAHARYTPPKPNYRRTTPPQRPWADLQKRQEAS